jgi:hypothetical protein
MGLNIEAPQFAPIESRNLTRTSHVKDGRYFVFSVARLLAICKTIQIKKRIVIAVDRRVADLSVRPGMMIILQGYELQDEI